MKTLFKLSLIVSLLLASSGVAFYYAVYLPRRDVQLDNERKLEKAQADARNRVAQERSLANQKKSEQRQAEAKVGAEAHYQTCLNRAERNPRYVVGGGMQTVGRKGCCRSRRVPDQAEVAEGILRCCL